MSFVFNCMFNSFNNSRGNVPGLNYVITFPLPTGKNALEID